MHKVDISDYKLNDDDAIYYCRVTLKKGYVFANGDEYFYKFIGKNSCYSLLEIVHPDDVNELRVMLEHVGTEPQCALMRLKNGDGRYKYLYAVFKKNGKVIDSFETIDFEFCDFMAIQDRYVYSQELLTKYRQFLSLTSKVYYEYTHSDRKFKIYKYVNRKCCPVYYESIDMITEEVKNNQALSDVDKANFLQLFDLLIEGNERVDYDIKATSLDDPNNQVEYSFKGTVIEDTTNGKMGVGVVDIIKDDKSKKDFYYLSDAAYDPGTGILNKKAINEYAVKRLSECKAQNSNLYMAILDVDDFKHINDNYGHMYGDKVLYKVAEIMRTVLGNKGLVGRFGGDEFMMVIDEAETETELRTIVKTICKHISWAFHEDDKPGLSVTTSWGIVRFPDDGETYDELFQKADKSLYIAKRKGKNRYIIYDEQKHGNVVNEKEERSTGIKAIASETQKMTVMSQLILDLHAGKDDVLNQAMITMQEYFDMDGVAVYAGDDMKRVLSIGKYVNPIQNLTCIFDKEYQGLFDENGVYAENTINRLNTTYVEAYKMYELQENGKFIQFISYKNGKPAAVVAFDFFNRSPKMGAFDQGMITIVGRLMVDIVSQQDF